MKEADSVVQTLNDVLEKCSKRIATVQNKGGGGGAIRMIGDPLGDRDRGG